MGRARDRGISTANHPKSPGLKVPPEEFQLHVGGRAWGTSSKPGKTLTWKVSASTFPHGDGIPWDSPGDLPQIPLQAQGSGTAALSRSSHGSVRPPSLFIPASLLLLPAGSPPRIPLTRAGAIRKLRPLGLLHPAHSSSHRAAARSGNLQLQLPEDGAFLGGPGGSPTLLTASPLAHFPPLSQLLLF